MLDTIQWSFLVPKHCWVIYFVSFLIKSCDKLFHSMIGEILNSIHSLRIIGEIYMPDDYGLMDGNGYQYASTQVPSRSHYPVDHFTTYQRVTCFLSSFSRSWVASRSSNALMRISVGVGVGSAAAARVSSREGLTWR